jgi:hypothetical protein
LQRWCCCCDIAAMTLLLELATPRRCSVVALQLATLRQLATLQRCGTATRGAMALQLAALIAMLRRYGAVARDTATLQCCGAVTLQLGMLQRCSSRCGSVLQCALLFCNRRCYTALQRWRAPPPKCLFCFFKFFYSLVEGKFVRIKQEERKRKRGELWNLLRMSRISTLLVRITQAPSDNNVNSLRQ